MRIDLNSFAFFFTCFLYLTDNGFGDGALVEQIRTLLCYSLIGLRQLRKSNDVIFLQDVFFRITENFTKMKKLQKKCAQIKS